MSKQKVIHGECIEELMKMKDNSVDMCLSDAPYGIEFLDSEKWNDYILEKQKSNSHIKTLPKGMKFDSRQGKDLQVFIGHVSEQIFRVLKPGGIYLSFSQARLYHRMAVAIEDCGFEIRDMIGWIYEGQAKAFSQNHIIEKQKNLSEEEKQELKNKLEGWKTIQLKPCIEPIVLSQKPTDGKYLDNWMKWNVGFLNTKIKWDNKFPGNIIQCKKPNKQEKNDNTHPTVKPLDLISHLIQLFTTENQIILDPFLGSGTTAVSCKKLNRNCIGIEKNETYINICNKRLERVEKE